MSFPFSTVPTRYLNSHIYHLPLREAPVSIGYLCSTFSPSLCDRRFYVPDSASLFSTLSFFFSSLQARSASKGHRHSKFETRDSRLQTRDSRASSPPSQPTVVLCRSSSRALLGLGLGSSLVYQVLAYQTLGLLTCVPPLGPTWTLHLPHSIQYSTSSIQHLHFLNHRVH